MSLDSLIQRDALAFVDPDLMPGCETITYTPRAGAPRTINAVVSRNGVEASGVDGVNVWHIEVEVRNHATLGVDATTLDTGGDTFTIPDRIGKAAREYGIRQAPVYQDSAMLKFIVR